jgi:NhaA family Na+:H+ antiporter
VAALFVPATGLAGDREHSPLRRLEHSLHPWVAFGILPIFAFSNAGVALEGMSLRDLLQPIPLGIMLGLFVGKQVGVFTFAWAAVKLGIARLPTGVEFRHVYGAAIICGIGFTMSLFIGMLAFEDTEIGKFIVTDKLGILVGSLTSAVVGYVVLHLVLPKGRCSNP